MSFPIHRQRRLRQTSGIRYLVRETHLVSDDLIYPIFVSNEITASTPLSAIPGCNLMPSDSAGEEARRLEQLGIRAALLFGVVSRSRKDELASVLLSANGPVQSAVRAMKAAAPELTVIADLCLCEYTSHGHCGILSGGEIHNAKRSKCFGVPLYRWRSRAAT